MGRGPRDKKLPHHPPSPIFHFTATMASALSSDESQIPIVDFGLFPNGTKDQKRAISAQIKDAFQNVGFVYLTNHGVPGRKVDECFGWVSNDILTSFHALSVNLCHIRASDFLICLLRLRTWLLIRQAVATIEDTLQSAAKRSRRTSSNGMRFKSYERHPT